MADRSQGQHVAVSCAKGSRFVPGEWEEEALRLPESDPHDLAAQKNETPKRRSRNRVTTILATLMPSAGGA
jgi:hypothetical protein